MCNYFQYFIPPICFLYILILPKSLNTHPLRINNKFLHFQNKSFKNSTFIKANLKFIQIFSQIFTIRTFQVFQNRSFLSSITIQYPLKPFTTDHHLITQGKRSTNAILLSDNLIKVLYKKNHEIPSIKRVDR